MIEHEIPEPEAEPTKTKEQSGTAVHDQEASLERLNLQSPNPIPDGFVEVKELNHGDSFDSASASDSEDGRIQGVYFEDENGDLVEYDTLDSDDD